MLTNKDYCDYDTCVALKELGYKVPTSAYYMPNNKQLFFVSNPYRGGYVTDCFYSHNSLPKDVMTANFIDAPTLWEAQKWLREKKKIEVVILGENEIGGPYCADVYTEGGYAGYIHKTCVKYEEALLEGIKAAIEILTNNENE